MVSQAGADRDTAFTTPAARTRAPGRHSELLNRLLDSGFPQRGAGTGAGRNVDVDNEPVEGADLEEAVNMSQRQENMIESERPVAGDAMSNLINELEKVLFARLEAITPVWAARKRLTKLLGQGAPRGIACPSASVSATMSTKACTAVRDGVLS
jgi:hypothetical protein